MKYKPKKNNKNVFIASSVYALLVVTAFVLEGFHIGYTFMNQLTVLVAATAAIYTLRYLIFDYVYTVDDGYIEVVRVGSKLPKTFASVKMSKEDLVVREEKDMSRYGVVKKERFRATLFGGSENMYWYIFTLDGERQALILECEPSFAEFLKNYIKNIDNNSLK